MRLFYRSPRPPFRWQLGLLWPGLPRRPIDPLAALRLHRRQLRLRGPDKPVSDPTGQGPAVQLGRPLEQLLFCRLDTEVYAGVFGGLALGSSHIGNCTATFRQLQA